MSLLKRFFHRAYQSLEIKDHELLYLFMEITRRCNLNCLHCGSDCKSQSSSPELTTDSWFKIIDYMAERYSPQLAFVITGGEPLLHSGLTAIGKHIVAAGRRWGMVTNGMALSPERFGEIISAGISAMTLSLDGTESAHNELRNHPHAFSRVLKALELIGDSDIESRDVVTCVYPGNLDQLDEVAEILIDKGIPAWRLFRIFPSGRAKNNPDLQLSFDGTNRLLGKIAEMREKYRDRGLKINYSCEGYLPFVRDLTVRDEPFFCRAGINIASVLSDGFITGCTNNHVSFYEGNILENDFDTLWRNGFRRFRDRSWAKTGVCAHCAEFKFCKGSSIHLWGEPLDGIAFCYVKDVNG